MQAVDKEKANKYVTGESNRYSQSKSVDPQPSGYMSPPGFEVKSDDSDASESYRTRTRSAKKSQ